MLRNTTASWGSLARLLHWVGAAGVIFLVVLGWWMTHVTGRSGRLPLYQLHSLIGYYVLLLFAARLVWRAFNPTPALPADSSRWARVAAHGAHGLLYLLTFGACVSGWVMVGTMRRPIEVTLFGFLPVPVLTRDRALHEMLEDTHEMLSYTLLTLVAVHVVAALNHHFVHGNDVLRRMGWGATTPAAPK